VCEAVSRDLGRAIKLGRGRSNREGGERLRAAPLLLATVKSPELGRACATAVSGSLELGREGQNDSTNSVVGLWPRVRGQRGEWRGKGLGQAGGTPVRSGGVSRARAGAGLREMRWGSECGTGGAQKGAGGHVAGVVVEDSDDVRKCARAGPRRAWGGRS
jgi:hypothetical protein